MDKMEKLYDDYLSFIKKVRNDWTESAKKAKDFGDEDEYVKEQIKIQVSHMMESVFKVKYNQAKGE